MIALAESGYHQPVNVGNPDEFTLLELAEIVVELTGSSSEIVFEALPTDDPKVRKPDIALAKKILDWEPTSPCARGCGAPWTSPASTCSSARRGSLGVVRDREGPVSRAPRTISSMTNPRHLAPSHVEDSEMPQAIPASDVDVQAMNLPATDVLPDRDMRAKRPPLLSFLLRWDTLRRAFRVLSLLAIDLGAIVLAIFTALSLKAAVRDAWNPAVSWEQAKDYTPFAFLVASLLFARSGLYADRAVRPGLTRIVASLFQTTVRRAGLRGRQRRGVLELLHLLRHAVLRGRLRVDGALRLRAGAPACCCGRPATSAAPCSSGRGEQIEAVAHALLASGGHSPVQVVGFVSLTPRPDNGLRSLGTLDEIGDIVDEHKVDEVIIADPAFPQQKAVDLVDTCHQRGVVVRIAPSTMEILIHRAEFVPGQSVPLFELKPPVFDGIDFALKRTFDLDRRPRCCCSCSARCCCVMRAGGAHHLARPDPLPLGASGHRRRAVRVPEVPHDVPRTPTRARPSSRRSNEASGALFKMRRRPARDAGRPDPAPLLDRRAAAAHQRARAARCRSSGRGRCPSATSTASRTGTRSATSCCPASPACGRSRAARTSTSTTSSASTSSTSSAGRSSWT